MDVAPEGNGVMGVLPSGRVVAAGGVRTDDGGSGWAGISSFLRKRSLQLLPTLCDQEGRMHVVPLTLVARLTLLPLLASDADSAEECSCRVCVRFDHHTLPICQSVEIGCVYTKAECNGECRTYFQYSFAGYRFDKDCSAPH
jgi:hypothetical protein